MAPPADIAEHLRSPHGPFGTPRWSPAYAAYTRLARIARRNKAPDSLHRDNTTAADGANGDVLTVVSAGSGHRQASQTTG